MKQAGLPAIIVVVMGCAAMAAAQSTSGAQAPHRGSSTATTARAQSANAQNQQITLVGCLMPGAGADQNAAVGTTGTTGSSRSTRAAATGETFMLSNVMPGSGPASGNNEPKYTPNSVGNTGTTASVGTTGGSNRGANDRDNSAASSASSAGTSSSYILQGMDLTSQVGQRVEVMGVMVPEKASRSRSSRRGVTGTSGTTGADASVPRLRVTSVRMLAADCNGSESSSPSRTPASGTSSPGSSTTSPAGTSGTGISSPTDRPGTASPTPPPSGDNTSDRERDNNNNNNNNPNDARPSPSTDAPGNNR